jgi:hypothetical protein
MTEDLTGFVDDLGVACVFGVQSFKAIFDTPDESLSFASADVQSTEFRIRYITQQAVLTPGLLGTVAGAAYRVRSAPKLAFDGAFSTAMLVKQ